MVNAWPPWGGEVYQAINMVKRQDIELLRIISAFGVVWYHSGVGGHTFAFSGLIVFLMLSMYLAGASVSTGSPRALQRIKRLLTPWMVWFAIYGVVNLLTGWPIVPLSGSVATGILSGPSIHLWYVPFILICLLLFDVIRNNIPGQLVASGSAILAILILVTTPLWARGYSTLGYPAAQYVHASAAVSIGIFLYYFDKLSLKVSLALLVSILGVAAAFHVDVGVPYLIAIIAMGIIATRITEKSITFNFGLLSRYVFGIYLVHIFVLRVFLKFDLAAGILMPILVFVISAFLMHVSSVMFPKYTKYWM